MISTDLETRLARFVEHHVLTGQHLPLSQLCEGRPDLDTPLRALVDRYLGLAASLDDQIPALEGFQVIERIGRGGMGEVFKLRDLRLDRIVAAKVVRRGTPGWAANLRGFLNEARTLALFSDPRIVKVFEFRPDAEQPVIVMEFVDGFELGRIGPSLECAQRARIMAEVCAAIHHAHRLGLQHRDLKPSNIMLDTRLAPRILDFGLSAADSTSGHLRGTLPYVAPEQLDPARPLDARTDVYALGVILYELICGRPPYEGNDEEVVAQIREGRPVLPVERDPTVPEPLQAVALAAMDPDPSRRYQSALDMEADLRRFLEGRRVLARPAVYSTTLGSRVRPHLDHITEWLRLRLIYAHEAERLRGAYAALEAREDDWIVESRALSYSQIALYCGAFLLLCGSLFYFVAARVYEKVGGLTGPALVLGLPFVGLNAAAHLLYKKDHKAVAVAFYLAAIALLPLFLLIAFHETNFLEAPAEAAGQLLARAIVSNRQLQVTTALACAWCAWLALRTRTVALSTVFTALVLLFTLALLSDFGLRAWWDEGRWDRLALHLFPLVVAYSGLGYLADRVSRPWLARPVFLGAAVLLIVLLEMLALNGRAFEYLGGLSLTRLQPRGASDAKLLDTIAAMTINGVTFYGVALALQRRGSESVNPASHLLFSIAPFAMLHPIGYLVRTFEYSPRFDWGYAAMATVIMALSQARQRRSFYFAGMLNLGLALYWIAARRDWFGRPAWAVAIVAGGLLVLAAGLALDWRQRRR